MKGGVHTEGGGGGGMEWKEEKKEKEKKKKQQQWKEGLKVRREEIFDLITYVCELIGSLASKVLDLV